jgi:hypothetical protein
MYRKMVYSKMEKIKCFGNFIFCIALINFQGNINYFLLTD